jgi:CRP-like cAMP-binding protein
VQSLTLTAAVIFILMAAMFLSARVGVIAMIPNLFPIVIFFGLMGVTGVALNFGTNIIASIALGLAVDDTLHIMCRLSSELRNTDQEGHALIETLSTVGKPALYYSGLLVLGFLTLGTSRFVPIQAFGLLSAATIVIGVIGELLLLPALLATTRIITLWDLLYLKLGKDPHKTIPLFDGHLLLSGAADVIINPKTQARRVRTLRRGDVLGEMALIGNHVRTADVVATDEVEVLAVNDRFLNRMQQRYPRIGAKIFKIFLNLAKILSTRLQDAQRPTS